MDLPTPLCVHTLNHLGEKQEELSTFIVISKKLNEDCKQTDIKWYIIPTIIASPLEHSGRQTLNLFLNLHHKNKLLQRYCLMIIQNVQNFLAQVRMSIKKLKELQVPFE